MLDWAEKDNTDAIPSGKLGNAPGLTQTQVDARVKDGVLDWAEKDNTDPIPVGKLSNAPAGEPGPPGPAGSDPVYAAVSNSHQVTLDTNRTGGTRWTEYTTLATAAALTQAGVVLLQGQLNGTISATPGATAQLGANDRIELEISIYRTHANGATTRVVAGRQFIRNMDDAGASRYETATREIAIAIDASEEAQIGDVYRLQVRMIAQSNAQRRATFPPLQQILRTTILKGAKGDKGDRGPGASDPVYAAVANVGQQIILDTPAANDTWSAWTTLVTSAALAQAGVVLLQGHVDANVTAAPGAAALSGGGDRVEVETRLQRTRAAATTTITEAHDYVRNVANVPSSPNYQAATRQVLSDTETTEQALVGDVYTLQARIIAQSTEQRRVSFGPSQQTLKTTLLKGAKGDTGLKGDPGGLTQQQVDDRVTAGVSDWAEEGNTDEIPSDKLPAATGGGGLTLTPVAGLQNMAVSGHSIDFTTAQSNAIRNAWNGDITGLVIADITTGGIGGSAIAFKALYPALSATQENVGIRWALPIISARGQPDVIRAALSLHRTMNGSPHTFLSIIEESSLARISFYTF